MKNLLKLLISVCFVMSVYSTPAGAQTVRKAKSTVPALNAPQMLVNKLQTISAACSRMGKTFTIAGTMSLTSRGEVNMQEKDLQFEYAVKGNNMYYRIGKVETINANGVYLYIDHEHKQITVSAQKTLVFNPPLQNPAALAASLKTEQYEISGRKDGALQVIVLTNERHISCRQVTLAYDTTRLEIKLMTVRYTDPEYPADQSKDRQITTRINRWEGRADLSAYINPGQVVIKKGDTWQTCHKFKQYELTII